MLSAELRNSEPDDYAIQTAKFVRKRRRYDVDGTHQGAIAQLDISCVIQDSLLKPTDVKLIDYRMIM
jgi:hypothetical protein